MATLREALEHCVASLEHLMAFKGSRLEESQREGHLLNITRAREALARKDQIVISREIQTLVEDFDNPCFSGKIHNEIPHQIGMHLIAALKEQKPCR